MNMIKLSEMPQRIPLNGTFELTTRCNLKCKMCLFRHADREFPLLKSTELTAAQWIDMGRQAAEMGTICLLITGGEPMIREDFCEIWEGIYKLGFIIELYTNATMVTDRVMETLRKYPPHKIGITIYGASAETYQKVCGNGAMYERALEGIQKLITLPSIVSFRSTIIKDNFQDVEAIEKLVSDDWGFPENLVTTRLVNKAVRGACGKAEECRLDPEDNIRLFLFRSRMRLREFLGDRFNEDHYRFEEYIEPKDDGTNECKRTGEFSLFGCDAGMKKYTVTYNGKLLGCQMLGAFQTDAKLEGLKEAWATYPLTVSLPPMNEKCRNCKHVSRCMICPASIYAETGSFDGWPEYICKDTETYMKKIKTR